MLSGRRPDSIGIYSNREYWRLKTANITTIPQYFKQHGYATYGMGKIFHQGPASNNQDPISWSDTPYFPLHIDIKLYDQPGNNTHNTLTRKVSQMYVKCPRPTYSLIYVMPLWCLCYSMWCMFGYLFLYAMMHHWELYTGHKYNV